MNNRLKSLLTSPRSLESRLASAIEVSARTAAPTSPAKPFELVELAAEEIASHVHLAGRGRYTFPFNSVTITFIASTAEDRARFHAICAGPPTIAERVVRRLGGAGCNITEADVDVSVLFAASADSSWTQPFHVALARVGAAARLPRGPGIRVDLLVTHGTAERGAYTFTTLPIAIGRGADVRDSRHQLLRINHVAFTDGDDEVNKTVSRRHARIEVDPDTNRLRVIDDNSAQGTSIIRKSRGIPVPKGSRGLGLQSDDEIVIGQARMRVQILQEGL